jgi:methionyl-tRNA synthetase
MSSYYITTPIYYVNDRPHIGHAYTTILADVLARYHRLLGEPAYFLTGTDEHGQKVEQAARKRGIDPQVHADETVAPFQALWKKLEITHDDFIRTTEDRHKRIVQEILQDLYDRGEIYQSSYDGWYSVTDERFYTEKELIDGKSPDSGQAVEKITESNYFFRMSAYQEWLVSYIEANPEFIQPDFRRNETRGFLRNPLQDLCISRPKKRLAWGIELPFDDAYVCYVWFDALVNYISAIGYRRDEAAFTERWPADCQLIGKDILTTHTVYWPTMLRAMGLPMPRTIFAHGWWLSGETKMSKSLGNVVHPMDLIDRYGVDPFRYFLIAGMVLGQDASFTEDLFISRYNAELANDLGNLHRRLVSMMGRYCDGRVPGPEPTAPSGPPEQELWATAVSTADVLEASVRNMSLDQGIAEVMTLVRGANRYLELKQPWTQAKQKDRAPLHTTLYTAAEALRVAAGLLYPVMPERMGALRSAYGLTKGEPEFGRLREWGVVRPGSRVARAESLFPKIATEASTREAVPAKTPEEQPAAPAAGGSTGLIRYEDFSKVALRTGRVMAAERVAGTDKLLRLEVMIGSERRQVVAGLAAHYTPDQLLGKTVVVVTNLQPATIRGLESQGMLLAASKGESLRLVTVDGELSSGAIVR